MAHNQYIKIIALKMHGHVQRTCHNCIFFFIITFMKWCRKKKQNNNNYKLITKRSILNFKSLLRKAKRKKNIFFVTGKCFCKNKQKQMISY